MEKCLSRKRFLYRARSVFVRQSAKKKSRVRSVAGQADDVVIDVGANIGLITRALAQKVSLRAARALARMYELLRENIEQNDLRNVSAHQLGSGAIFGKAGLRDRLRQAG